MIAKLAKTAFIALISLSTPILAQIEAGTSVSITIMGVPPEEKGKIDAMYPVGENGTVNLPFIGRIRAAGLRPEALASSIQNAYRAAQIYTSPTIQVIGTQSGLTAKAEMVHAGGQVRRPGPVNYQKNLTIYQAVQAAGGATEFGSLKRVKLYRDGKTTSYDLTDPQSMRTPLRPNDTLEVPQKNWLGR